MLSCWGHCIDFNSLDECDTIGSVKSLLKNMHTNNSDSPCVFIRKPQKGFVSFSIYVDNLNIIWYIKDIEEDSIYLRPEFKTKDLGKSKLCLGLQIEHFFKVIFVHESIYNKMVLERFNINKYYLLRTLMVVRSLKRDTSPFRPKSDDGGITWTISYLP